MRNGMKNTLVLLLAACLLFACVNSTAESMHEEISNPSFDLEITVGYNGNMTYGKVMPVRVRIRNYGDDFEGILGMNAYVSNREYDRYEKSVAIPAGSSREYELLVTVYARQDSFTAELLKDGEVVCASSGAAATVINPSAMMIGVLSTRPQNLKNLDINNENDTLSRYEFWQTIALTQADFPEQVSALKSFGMLMIDDVDPASLSDKQRKALDDWLRSGRILVCGGGANASRNIAYFNQYTELSLKEVTTSDYVLQGLENMSAGKRTGRKVTTAIAEYDGGEPLGKDNRGRGLVYRSAAGAGRIYTAAFEIGEPQLNSEKLMHSFWQQLLLNYDQELYSSVMYANAGNDNYNFLNASGFLPVSAKSRMLSGMLIVAGLLLVACVLWWILKKRDLRQWMWLVLPLLSVVAVACLVLLSFSSETNRPMAVIAENLIQESSGEIRDYRSASVAVPSYGRHSFTMAGDDLKVMTYDYVNYDEDEEKNYPEPTKMRTCYSAGGDNIVSVESITPWETTELISEADPDIQGQISGLVWMEEDGIHGEIENGTDQKLSAGYMVTSYGFTTVPELEPGEKADILLKKGTFADPQNPEYKDGFMYTESPGMYSVVYAAVGYDELRDSGRPEGQEKAAIANMINNAADLLRRGRSSWFYGPYETAMYLYSAKPEGRKTAEISVDGNPVKQKADTALLTVELKYQTVGRTGVVFRNAGMDLPVRVETDDELMPVSGSLQSAQSTKNMMYHTLNENPTFLFELDDLKGVRVEHLQIIQSSYYIDQTVAYALNVRDHTWEQIEMNVNIDHPERYLDENGKLYVQFRLDGKNMYADISTPMIIVEGRQENAED